MISRLVDTNDFIDLSLFNYIVTQSKKHLETYHFCEIATPIIESTELFKQSLGSTTDLICTEISTRATQKESICLRPEATSSIARVFDEHGITQIPWKVYTCGPMFRQQDEHVLQYNQVSTAMIGASSPSYDVQLITMFDRFFSQTLSINSYALMLNFLGCKSNNAQCNIDHLCQSCEQEWATIQEQLDLLSVTYSWEPSLTPNFDYYNKMIFAFTSAQLGAQNRFCAGGRCHINNQTQQTLAAALEIERLMQLLEPFKEILPLPQAPALSVIVPLGVEQQMLALLIADNLRAQGLCVDIFLENDSLQNMLKQANKMGASYCLLLGQEEQKARIVTIKNMITGVEDKVQQIDIYTYLTR